MNKYIPLTLSLIVVALTSGHVNANSVEVSYEDWVLPNLSLSGASVSGSLDITDSISLEMTTVSVDTSVTLGNAGVKYNGMGVGYKTDLSNTIEVKAVVEYVDSNFWSETNSGKTSQKLSGMVYETSLTVKLTDSIDGMVGLSESNVDGTTTATIFGISVDITDSMTLTFSSADSQADTQSLGLRYSF